MARFEVKRGNVSVRYEFPSATGEWEQSSLEEAPGPGFVIGVFPSLDETGRQILLEEFGLRDYADELPLSRIKFMSHLALEAFKRR